MNIMTNKNKPEPKVEICDIKSVDAKDDTKHRKTDFFPIATQLQVSVFNFTNSTNFSDFNKIIWF